MERSLCCGAILPDGRITSEQTKTQIRKGKEKKGEGGLSGEDFIVRIRPEMLLDMPARLPSKLTIFFSSSF